MINKGAESLPPKDGQAYKQLAKFYDAKNYKKGLKNADKLLEIHPDHPETNALKALFLQAIGEDAKALQISKFALIKSKMKSMFCWHTCGSIYKQKKDFYQAAKCFQNALKLQPDNSQLMKETACLQIQVRDHTNHTASRFAILRQKPNLIQNWVAFTMAHHLRGDFPSLFKALISLDNLIKTTELKPTELAHYYLYRVVAYRDAAIYDKMYEELHKNKAQIKDQVMYNELLFHACSELGKTGEAVQALQFLLKKYPQNLQYLKQYQNFNHITRREACAKARIQFKSKIAHVHQLACIEDSEQFKKQFLIFVKPYYTKNLISLFAQIQILYETGKYDHIQTVFLELQKSLEKDVYPDGTEASSPSEYLWSIYLLAQHYSQRFQTLTKAHQYILKALKHTCTVSEFYLVKAEIQYKQHNNFASLKTINQARKTDLADRYMNNICVKYLMKCEKPDIGETVLRLFMRDDASLYELQNHWYIIQAAKSFLKQRNFQAGLRHLDFITKQFLDFQGNQFDFHTYCLRRWTLREYVELIEFNDNIYDDKKYVQAAGIAIRYLKQYVHKVEEDERNAAKKLQEQAKDEKEGKKKKKKKKAEQQTVHDEPPHEAFRNKIDYYGKQYSAKIKKNPLQEALNFAKCVAIIKFTNKENVYQNKLFGRAFAESIDIFIHFKKPLLVLRLINKLLKTKTCPFTTHFSVIKAIIYLQSYLVEPKANDLAKQMILQFLNSTLQGKSLAQYNEVQISKWKDVVSSDLIYLLESKKIQANIILKNAEPRNQLIQFYLKELNTLSQGQAPNAKQLQLIFYYTHRLQFYGRLSEELKTTLNTRVGHLSTYFSNWRAQIPKMPESTWSAWWLSDYDIEREELQDKVEKQKSQEIKKQAAKA